MYLPEPFFHRQPPHRIHFGPGQARHLEPILADVGSERALVLCGRQIARNEALVGALVDGAGGRVALVHPGARPHPPAATVDDAVAVFRAAGCDALVSLGGGSTHDTARGVALCLRTGLSILEHFADASTSFVRYLDERPGVTLIGVPSTFSAAEATFGGGVVAEGRKFVFVGHALYADHLVLDPEVYATTPLPILLETGMNATNHAIERLLSPHHQPIADAAFLHALRLLLPNLERLAANGVSDEEALASCVLGAYLSTSTNVVGGIGHAVAHVLGGRYGVSHGIVNGIVLPHTVAHGASRTPSGLRAIARELAAKQRAEHGSEDVAGVAAALAEFVRNVGLPGALRDLGVPEADLDEIADDVLKDFSAGGISRDEVAAFLEAAW